MSSQQTLIDTPQPVSAPTDAEDAALQNMGNDITEKALVLQQAVALEAIKDDVSYERVAKAGVEAATNIKALEAILNPLKERRYRAWKRVTEVLGAKAGPFEEVKARASRLCGAYQAEKERLQKQAEEAERERLAKEAEAARAQEANNLANEGRIEEGLAVLESKAVPMAPVVTSGAAPKVKGMGKARQNYKVTVTNLMALVKAVAEGKVPIKAIQADEAWLKKQAQLMEELFDVPGVKAEKDFATSFRG